MCSGKQDLYLVFNGGSGFLMNVDWWKFTGAGSSETITTATTTTKPVTTTSTTTTKTATENITPVADTGGAAEVTQRLAHPPRTLIKAQRLSTAMAEKHHGTAL